MGKRLAVITGGTKGIGKEIIFRFAEEGFDIATCARTQRDLDELQRSVSQKHKIQVHVLCADLSERNEITAFVNFVTDLQTPVEVLVNNTGYFVPGQIHEEEEGVLEHMMSTNLFSAYHISRGIIPGMKSAGRGHIFNMCSIASQVAYANGGSYCITKFAMLGMSKVMREEMKPFGIRVTSVMPGATYTASWEGAHIEEARFMDPVDVAQMVVSAYKLSGRSVVEDLVIRPQLGDL